MKKIFSILLIILLAFFIGKNIELSKRIKVLETSCVERNIDPNDPLDIL